MAPDRLPAGLRNILADPSHTRFLSAASVWEIAIKTEAGRLRFPMDRLEAAQAALQTIALPIRHAHAIAAGRLPRHHADPFDRMLVAQAHIESLILVSMDAALARYDVPQLRL